MQNLDKFYNQKSWNQPHNLEAKIKNYNDTFSIELVGNNQKPDCCIGHFGYNFYFRTPYGMKEKKYKNLNTLFKAIKETAKNQGLVVESIGIKKYYKYRPINLEGK